MSANIKTYLLDNDEWFWPGLEEFCNIFDDSFKRINTDSRDHMDIDDYIFIGILSQPSVERIIVASGFDKIMRICGKKRSEELLGSKNTFYQIEHFTNLIEGVLKVRQILEFPPFCIEINYHGVDFIEDLKENKWGDDYKRTLQRIVRQNPDDLFINIYSDYTFKYRLTEKNIY